MKGQQLQLLTLALLVKGQQLQLLTLALLVKGQQLQLLTLALLVKVLGRLLLAWYQLTEMQGLLLAALPWADLLPVLMKGKLGRGRMCLVMTEVQLPEQLLGGSHHQSGQSHRPVSAMALEEALVLAMMTQPLM